MDILLLTILELSALERLLGLLSQDVKHSFAQAK